VIQSIAEALSTSDAEKWKQAISEELQSFEKNNAWNWKICQKKKL